MNVYFLPQISPLGRPRYGSGLPGVVVEKALVAEFSASAPGLSCIWGLSGTLPLQVTALATELAGGLQEQPGSSTAWDDCWYKVVERDVRDKVLLNSLFIINSC